MKWSILVCLLVCLARFCEGGALRCPPGLTECTEEKKEIADTKESTSPPSSSATECLAGTEWDSKCHSCRCTDAGIAECIKSDNCEHEVYEEPYLCKPNTTFVRECNKCLCLENGLALCSMAYCSDRPQITNIEDSDKKESTSNLEQTDIVVPTSDKDDDSTIVKHEVLKRSTVCKPNEEFNSDCNPCKCAADGRSYSCTQNECLEPDMEVEVFKQSEGTDHIERHSVCRARNTFYINCNACYCNSLGTDYYCTNRPCPLPADVELFRELKTKSPQNATKAVVCVANRMFVKDCNTCWCNEDGTSYYCTRRVCVPLLPDEEADLGGIPAEVEFEVALGALVVVVLWARPLLPGDEADLGEIPAEVNFEVAFWALVEVFTQHENLRVTKKQCRPDEVFELDCNMCRCNPDGKSYSCTRRACIEQDEKIENVTLSRKTRATEPTKACQPGQEFRLDCNKCLCDNEGQDFSCTRIDCNALNNNHASAFTASRRKRDATEKVSTECVAGSVFNRDCNVCRCTDDGNFALCTVKSCTQKKEQEHVSESETGFRCNAGEQFKRDCNDCTCSADGRSVFCTLRLCDQDITSDI